jgi:DNA-binding CsgD family transcriptional regulator
LLFRLSPRSPSHDEARGSSHSSGEVFGASVDDYQLGLVALSHTPLEDHLYRTMLVEVMRADRAIGAFSVRVLKALTGINSPSTIRRGLIGLIHKLSIENTHSNGTRTREGHTYQIFKPEEIFQRRRALGIPPYPTEIETYKENSGFNKAVERVARNGNLSRREAQVALACAEGMTNSEIGRRLSIGEQTVKFHLRNIFTKFGVKRRTELISKLLIREERTLVGSERRAAAGERS